MKVHLKVTSLVRSKIFQNISKIFQMSHNKVIEQDFLDVLYSSTKTIGT
jgi:hypothetical protein